MEKNMDPTKGGGYGYNQHGIELRYKMGSTLVIEVIGD
jgi:hypothetical protein